VNFEKSIALQRRLEELVPGGSHTYAKGEDQFPEAYPAIIARGDGCRVWDVDGNEYIEFGSGLRSVILGHGYPSVVQAACREAMRGLNFVRPAAIECEVAEHFLGLIRGAEMVKFAKNGSDATTAAVKLARAYTGRDLVAICGDQPFFSVDDWFIGATPMDAGIPKVIKDLTVRYAYNDIGSVQAIFDANPGQIACLILEAEKTDPPLEGFLHQVQSLCRQHGVVFILDEMITGFRYHLSGAQQIFDLDPDLSTFGKAMGNGFAVAALAGKREFMQLGGLAHDREKVFLMSTTHGAESMGLAACLETMKVCEREHVADVLTRQGERLAAGIRKSVEELHLQDFFGLAGRPCCLVFWTFDQDRKPSQPFRTLFLAELMKRGVLAPNLVVSFSHSDADIDEAIQAIAGALQVYRRALDEGLEKYAVGRSVKPVFRRFN